jgi:signal transduction histidine kinase
VHLTTALTRRRYLASAWPWRALAYLVTGAVTGLIGLTVMACLIVVGGLLSLVLVGLPILAAVTLTGVPLGAWERWRLRLIDPEPATDPHRRPGRPGPLGWAATRFREPSTWRELGYALLLVTVLWPLDAVLAVAAIAVPPTLLTAPVPVLVSGGRRGLWPHFAISTPPQAAAAVIAGIALVAACAYLVGAAAVAHGALARTMLTAREDELRDRLREVTRSRERLVNAFEAERRRIERDLHDGAQQRLAALALNLGLARLDLPAGPAADRVADAHEQARHALAELRELIHNIHPQILTERGLAAAIEDVAGRSQIPVDLDLAALHADREGPARPPQAIEAIGYFATCEALANIAKHSAARRAWITGRRTGGTLLLEIGDDGRGGAAPERGTGLTGLADRAAVVDGTVTLTSPAGGPTVLRVELPCDI